MDRFIKTRKKEIPWVKIRRSRRGTVRNNLEKYDQEAMVLIHCLDFKTTPFRMVPIKSIPKIKDATHFMILVPPNIDK